MTAPTHTLLNIPRLVLGGVSSGVGKTTAMVGLAGALKRRGLRVALFKVGPDYLDPTYHRRVAGQCHNLDGWMMGREAVLSTFARAAAGADIALVEGVMGLFDGASPTAEAGSTAELAKWLGAQVVLMTDAGGMARSFAALVQGYHTFDPELPLAGVLANRVGSSNHLALLGEALEAGHVGVPLLGGFPKNPEHAFAERHLGLRTADAQVPQSQLEAWAALAEEWVQMEALLQIAQQAPALEIPPAVLSDTNAPTPSRPQCRIGVAQDEAFHFYYPENLHLLERFGAELVPFSPLNDSQLPAVDGLLLGGGYPEVFAAELAANTGMKNAIAQFAEQGHPIYAECGGLMYLTQGIQGLDGATHEMVGVVPAVAVVHSRLQALGYVEGETSQETIVGRTGLRFRGHQFRYSELVGLPEAHPLAYRLRKKRQTKGRTAQPLVEGYLAPVKAELPNVLASYVHVHWASNPQLAEGLVNACNRGQNRGVSTAPQPEDNG